MYDTVITGEENWAKITEPFPDMLRKRLAQVYGV